MFRRLITTNACGLFSSTSPGATGRFVATELAFLVPISGTETAVLFAGVVEVNKEFRTTTQLKDHAYTGLPPQHCS